MTRIIRESDLCNCPASVTELCSDTCKHRRPWGTGKSLAERYSAQQVRKALNATEILRDAEQRVRAAKSPASLFTAQGDVMRARRALTGILDTLTVEGLTEYSKLRKG